VGVKRDILTEWEENVHAGFPEKTDDYAVPTTYLSKTEDCCKHCGLIIELRKRSQRYHKECKKTIDDACKQVFEMSQHLFAVRKAGFFYVKTMTVSDKPGVESQFVTRKVSAAGLSEEQIMGLLGLSFSKNILLVEGKFRGIKAKIQNCPHCGAELVKSERYFKFCRSCNLFYYAFKHKSRFQTSVDRKAYERAYELRTARTEPTHSGNVQVSDSVVISDAPTYSPLGPTTQFQYCNVCKKETQFESDNTAPPPFRNYFACVMCGTQPQRPQRHTVRRTNWKTN